MSTSSDAVQRVMQEMPPASEVLDFSVYETGGFGELLNAAQELFPACVREEQQHYVGTLYNVEFMLHVTASAFGVDMSCVLTAVNIGFNEHISLNPREFLRSDGVWRLCGELCNKLLQDLEIEERRYRGTAHHLTMLMVVTVNKERIIPRYTLTAVENATGETLTTQECSVTTLGLFPDLDTQLSMRLEKRDWEQSRATGEPTFWQRLRGAFTSP